MCIFIMYKTNVGPECSREQDHVVPAVMKCVRQSYADREKDLTESESLGK